MVNKLYMSVNLIMRAPHIPPPFSENFNVNGERI